MTTIRRRILAAVPALLFAVACSDSPSSPDADQQLNLDVANYVADMTSDDLYMLDLYSGMSTAPALASGPQPPRFSDLTITRDVTFYDEFGDAQAAYDPLRTAEINFVFHMEGSHARTGEMGSLEVEVNRDRDMWLSGLLGEETERLWNGTGSSAVSRSRVSDELGDRQYNMSASTVVENVLVQLPRSEHPWPVSGTITRQVHVEVVTDVGTVVKDLTVVITFDGEQVVTMTVNGEVFELDLAERHARRHRP
jgi:hypothetical protein